jgi:hypothetical protein
MVMVNARGQTDVVFRAMTYNVNNTNITNLPNLDIETENIT